MLRRCPCSPVWTHFEKKKKRWGRFYKVSYIYENAQRNSVIAVYSVFYSILKIQFFFALCNIYTKYNLWSIISYK